MVGRLYSLIALVVFTPLLAHGFCASCQFDGPATPADQPKWLANLISDRNKTLAALRFAGGVFDDSALKWTQSSYIQAQMHPYDLFFYDPLIGYTPERFLADLKERYGGVDAILMWPTYPDIGIDDRNQFDFFRSMPGGLEGVKNVTRALKAAGVRVLWPYNPCASRGLLMLTCRLNPRRRRSEQGIKARVAAR